MAQETRTIGAPLPPDLAHVPASGARLQGGSKAAGDAGTAPFAEVLQQGAHGSLLVFFMQFCERAGKLEGLLGMLGLGVAQKQCNKSYRGSLLVFSIVCVSRITGRAAGDAGT